MFCPQCGAPNEDDAIFCGNCGAVLDLDEASAQVETEEPQEGFAEEPTDDISEDEASELASFMDELPAEPPPPPPPPPAYAASVQTSGMAIASLVMGIAGWTVLPILGSILAIVFGYAGRNEIRRRPDELTGEGLAVAGLVLGWLMVGITILGLCLGAIGFCFFFGLMGASGY